MAWWLPPQQNGMRLIVVVMGAKGEKERADETRKMLEWGFRSFEARVLFAEGQTVGEAKVFGGDKGYVPLVGAGTIRLMVPRNLNEKIVARVTYTGPLPAPVERGSGGDAEGLAQRQSRARSPAANRRRRRHRQPVAARLRRVDRIGHRAVPRRSRTPARADRETLRCADASLPSRAAKGPANRPTRAARRASRAASASRSC